MSSIFKRRGYYYITYTIGNTRKRWSLGTTRKREAEAFQARLDRAYTEGRYNPLDESPTAFRDRIATREARPAVAHPLPELKERFLDERRHLKDKTLSNYRLVLRMLIEANGDLHEVLSGVSLQSKHMYRRWLNTFFRWAVKEGYRNENPAEKVVLPPKPKPRPRFFSKTEVERLRDHIRKTQEHPDRERWLAVVALGVYCGLRRKEMQALQAEWVDEDYLHFPCNEAFRTKSGREESVYIPTPARAPLAAVCEANPVFWGYHKSTFTRYFTTLLRDAGIDSGSLHTLRHTCASWMALEGISGVVIQQHLRHSSFAVTERYLHLSPTNTSAHVEQAFKAQ